VLRPIRALLERTRKAAWLLLQPGPLIVFARSDVSRVIAYRDRVNRLLFGAVPVGLRGVEGGSWNLLMVAYPVALGAGLWLATRGARGTPARRSWPPTWR